MAAFRRRFHACLECRTDALFELCDAILTSGGAPSLVHLSLYAALARGRVNTEGLHHLLAR